MKERLVLCVLLAWGCSNSGSIPGPDSGSVPDSTADRVADLSSGEGVADDRVAPDVLFREVETTQPDQLPDFAGPDESHLPECRPGEGCFLDGCSENADCLSGWCLEHMGESVCSTVCQEECPAGWQCKAAGGGPDVVSICISGHANLCKPCGGNADCKSVGGAEDVCIDYGDEGAFCGGSCQADDECPWGFACQQANTVEGVQVTQCVAETGVCPCTGKSVQLALTTPCEVVNEAGTCHGKRICQEEGLSSCDAPIPAVETCNGKDDDCDGDVDDPVLVEGQFVSTCDDGNDCTQDACKGADGCENLPLDSGECSDGNPCTVADHCLAGVCIGDPVQCDDENPCTDNVCTESGGCEYTANTDDCDDGDPCTVGDECNQGMCLGTEVPCDCLSDADCEALEDGDVCNGTLECSLGALPQLCVVKPGTVVDCPLPTGLGHECLGPACDPETGVCGSVPENDGALCDGQDACLVGSVCTNGQCGDGTPINCNDGNPCTDDTCDAALGCQHEPNASVCNDGDFCTTGDVCYEGQCVSSGQMDCDDDNPCTADSCDGEAGCLHAPEFGQCDDGNACTDGDACAQGVCKPGVLLVCDDSNACTADGCDPNTGCVNAPAAGSCSDGDPCTVGEKCVGGVCVGGVLQDCGDGNQCTKDYCDSNGKCVHSPLTGPCDDGNECTAGDHCAAGVCVFDGPTVCDDGNPCTTDACNPITGCHLTLNSDPCNDDNLCTADDHCHLGECIGGGQLACNDGNICTDDSCEAEAGCVFMPNTAQCSDGSVCTQGDVCAGGWCKPGPGQKCDDGDVCTDDFCDPLDGCGAVFNSAACEDGDACTMGDMCDEGQCLPGTSADCDDAKQCTADSCHPLLGCVNEPIVGSCDDGNACTEGDGCSEGVCVPGGAVTCNDNNQCTDDTCQPESGCKFSPNQLQCNDNSECTTGDVCKNGACAGVPIDCDDLNECTEDSCDSGSGCINTPVVVGTECEGSKVCVNGECVDCGQLTGSQTFEYTGGQQTFAVPECVESITIEAWGAQGGNASIGVVTGGKGGYAKGQLAVTTGQTVYVYVGGHPGTGKPGGFNGGGAGPDGGSTGGGGASDVRVNGTTVNDRVIVGAGGGGAAWESAWSGGWGVNNGACNGGDGGGLEGAKGGYWQNACQGGNGGTQSAGGAHGGSFSQGGPGNMPPGDTGGGGGGWYGGGGGGACTGFNGCGGGGSSFIGGVTAGQTQAGVQTGHGKVVISW